MHPISCAHCGNNFMRVVPNSDVKLCNNCLMAEERRNQNKRGKMDAQVDILIKCDREIQIKIEEYCINNGIDFTKYFMDLHDSFSPIDQVEEHAPTQKKGRKNEAKD